MNDHKYSTWKIIESIIKIGSLIEFFIKLPYFISFWRVSKIDIHLFGRIIELIGIIILFFGLISLFIKIITRVEPKRSVVDMIAPILLAEHSIKNTEEVFTKKLLFHRFINIGGLILIIGFAIVLITKLLTL